MNNQMICRRVTEDDDWTQLGHLIYSADPYLYVDLFGPEDLAIKTLCVLMNNPKSIFYYKNYYAVEQNEKIVGMAAFYKTNPIWNPEDVINAFYESGVGAPPSFDSVSEYFNRTFNHRNIGINACNIVVDEEYRRQGIASELLKYILKLSANCPIELNVLKNNTAAIKLYQKFGFFIIDEFEDYGGYQKPKIDCYKMMHD